MPIKTNWTTQSPKPSSWRPGTATSSASWPPIGADALKAVREPLRWYLQLGQRTAPGPVLEALRHAAAGPSAAAWTPPAWLWPHQVGAARRLVQRLACFHGALLADAVGLGKTYVALAVATRYQSPLVLVPASLRSQWQRVARELGCACALLSHEALSRGSRLPHADLVVVDEAHRFRNPDTRRYRALAGALGPAHLLLLTATPLVNHPADLTNLLRLFLPDHGLAVLGLPSLERAAATRQLELLAHAAAALLVARSPRAVRLSLPPLPAVHDAAVIAPPPLPPRLLQRLAPRLQALRFPSVTDRPAAELLRLHLWYRLASSPAAFLETLRRHRAYLERALAAASRGEALPRQAARRLFGRDDDLQLELEAVTAGRPAASLDARALLAEQRRIQDLIELLRQGNGADPKAQALQRLLSVRRGQKSIVFTAASATAAHLARTLAWRRLATVTASGARIATGAAALEEILAYFAPAARRAAAPPATLELDVLIATDLMSEGLDLQDADAVVHYDLPWTPLRLEQRLGRIARLGSVHRQVEVWWFRPAPCLDRQLALAERLHRKAVSQLRLGAATTSELGQGRRLGGLFDWREQFGAAAVERPAGPQFAVVQAPPVAAFALRWTIGQGSVPELLVLAGQPPQPVTDERQIGWLVEALAHAHPSHNPPPAELRRALRQTVRGRLVACLAGPSDASTRVLIRRLLALASAAARARRLAALEAFDRALEELSRGLPAGPLQALESVLGDRDPLCRLRAWLAESARPATPFPAVTLEAALFGDGSRSD